MVATAYIALGSNLGDRRRLLAEALERLGAGDDIQIERCSAFYETAPVGGPAGQGPFLNAAARLTTELAPAALLARMQAVEQDLGRVRFERWGPRTIDLDLLLYDDRNIDEPGLTVPHPRMHERRFVLEPLAEIASDLIHPVFQRTVRELLDSLQHEPRRA